MEGQDVSSSQKHGRKLEALPPAEIPRRTLQLDRAVALAKLPASVTLTHNRSLYEICPIQVCT